MSTDPAKDKAQQFDAAAETASSAAALAAFEEAVKYVLHKNCELYRRLA